MDTTVPKRCRQDDLGLFQKPLHPGAPGHRFLRLTDDIEPRITLITRILGYGVPELIVEINSRGV